MPSITSPGIGSGLDIDTLVSQLVLFEGQPVRSRLDRREATYQAELSAIGTFRSSLDTFQTALEKLSEIGEFNRTLSGGDEEIFTVSSDESAAPGTYDIEVVRLAQGQKLSSAAFASAESFVGDGTLTISVPADAAQGGGSFSLELLDSDETTLEGIRDAINTAEDNPGVFASIVNSVDGAHLVLNSTLTGDAKTITVTASGGNGGLEALAYDPPLGTTNLTEVQPPLNAEIRIDAFTHSSATNTVTSAIDGLTFELVSADPGTTINVSIGLDRDQTEVLVTDFVDAYNDLVTTVSSLTDYDVETRTSGALQGDSLVSTLMDRLSREFNKAVFLPLTSLRDIGISVSLEGTLDIDSVKLDDVIATDLNNLRDLFDDATYGVAVRMDAVIDNYLKADGLFDVRTDSLNASIEDITAQRERLANRLDSLDTRLRSQFLALDQLVAELNSTSGFLGTQLANLPSPTALLGNN
ncbi:MAG: flagellar filament capping protein FliD [Gammaproteobacteria bacterium]|nr:flagellar filament capping protein FliD [Gammaproteobacteria bacterium]